MHFAGKSWRNHTLAALFAGALFISSAQAQSPFNLTGVWQRNPEESDDAEQKVRDAAKAMFDKATRGGRNIPSDDIIQFQKRLQLIIGSYVQFAETLEIEQTNGELHIDDGEGRIRIFYIDGKKHKRQTPKGATLETVCTRGVNQITVEQKLDRGGKIIETYVPSPDGNRTVLTVRFESKQLRAPLILVNVYDRDQ
jgi:hypothetical protein